MMNVDMKSTFAMCVLVLCGNVTTGVSGSEEFQVYADDNSSSLNLTSGGDPSRHAIWYIDVIKDPKERAARVERLRHGKVIKQFHQTTLPACKLILKSQFRVGTEGLAGGGIYFAASPEQTAFKAQSFGCMMEVWVAVGHVKHLQYAGDTSLSLTKMAHSSLDSCWIPRGTPHGSAPEVVVYFSDQILQMTAYPSDRQGKKVGDYLDKPLSTQRPTFKCSEGDCDHTLASEVLV